MPERTLADIAAELYTAPPSEFVAARDAAAKAASDSELAASIRALRKPSIAAWVVNVFAHERTAQLGEALQLAAELREAQADLDARALSQLGRERRALTNRLAKEAADLASARGERVSASTLEAVQQTITAAFFDPRAADAVASTRLIRELDPSDDADPAGSVAGGAPDAAEPAPQPVDELKARRERRDAERAVHEAEKKLEHARREQERAERAESAAAARAEELASRARELEKELARVRRDAEAARDEADGLGEPGAEARRRVTEAEKAVEAARNVLDGLREPS